MAWTTPKTWSSAVLSSSDLNTHVRDNERFLKGLDGPIQLDNTVSVGTPGVAYVGFQVFPSLAGATSQVGVVVQPTVSTAATVAAYGIQSGVVLANATFTVGTAVSIAALTPAVGGGSSVTTNIGLLVNPMTSGALNNYGILVHAPSGGSGVNIGILVNGGGIQVEAGGINVSGTSLFNNDTTFSSAIIVGATTAASGAIRLANGALLAWRDPGNGFDIWFTVDSSTRLVLGRSAGTGWSTGGAVALTGSSADSINVVVNGVARKIPLI